MLNIRIAKNTKHPRRFLSLSNEWAYVVTLFGWSIILHIADIEWFWRDPRIGEEENLWYRGQIGKTQIRDWRIKRPIGA